ncbi:MAG TPA: protein BatD, partial [candidate division Zixibacteria bacterium]|nr:protein BatD [candidate division Zixibacteria bacterium]
DIFIGVDANKKSAYQGEQITVYFTLYSRLDLVNLSYKKDAEFKNAWVETIFEATRLQPRVVTIGGKRYYAFPIKTVAAFQLMPGYVTVEPMELKCVVQYPPRSFFDFGRRAEIIARSKPLKIKVLSLPEAGKPDGFAGAVGRFSFSLKADRDTLSVGDALGITVRVSGAGNIETITLPQPQFPQDFEVFDKKEKVTKDVKGEQIIGTKTAEYVVVPHSEGEFIIPPVEFSYFNPRTRKYVKLLSDSIRIVVGPGKGVSVVGPVGRSRIVAVGGDIEFIKPDALRLTVGRLSLPNGLRALWFIPIEILAILGAYAYRLRYERMLKDIKRIKASRAFKEAQRKLSGVRRAKDAAQALSAIYDAIFQFIAAKLGIEAGAVIFDEAAAKLMEKGVPEETIEGLRDALDKIHSSRFAPAGEHCDVVELSEKVREYLKTIDETFGRT